MSSVLSDAKGIVMWGQHLLINIVAILITDGAYFLARMQGQVWEDAVLTAITTSGISWAIALLILIVARVSTARPKEAFIWPTPATTICWVAALGVGTGQNFGANWCFIYVVAITPLALAIKMFSLQMQTEKNVGYATPYRWHTLISVTMMSAIYSALGVRNPFFGLAGCLIGIVLMLITYKPWGKEQYAH